MRRTAHSVEWRIDGEGRVLTYRAGTNAETGTQLVTVRADESSGRTHTILRPESRAE
jgi:hypothetical protein